MYRYLPIIIYFLMTIACNNNAAEEKLLYKEIKYSNFPNQLKYRSLKMDTSIIITILDNNQNGYYFDSDSNSFDYLNVINSITGQINGIVFKKNITLNYNSFGYYIHVDTLSKYIYLSPVHNPNVKPDITIFNSLPNIRIYDEFNPSNENNIKTILSELNCKFVLLDFWASYCSPCREDIEFYQKYEAEIVKNGLRVIFISPDTDYDESLNYLNQKKFSEHFYFCSKADMKKLNCEGYPNGILVDSVGNYIRHFSYSSISNVVEYVNRRY